MGRPPIGHRSSSAMAIRLGPRSRTGNWITERRPYEANAPAKRTEKILSRPRVND